jgi:hypothetical protein
VRHIKTTIIAALLACSSAHAEFYSGNDLFNRLNGNDAEQFHALGYIMGMHDALDGVVFCSTQTVTAGQVRDLMKMTLERDPANRHKPASALIMNTLQVVWPCKKQGAKL